MEALNGGDVDSKLVRGPIRGGTCAVGQRGGDGEEQKQAPSFSPGIEQQNPSLSGPSKKRCIKNKNKKTRCRNRDWSKPETRTLLNCMNEGGRFRNRGNFMNWEATGQEIKKVFGFTRTKEECQNRSDTLMKAHNEVKNSSGGDYKQFFRLKEEDRPVKLSTHLTEECYEKLEQIKQKKKRKPRHLSSSDSDGSPSLGGTQTPSRSEDAGSKLSGTNLISSPENSPSPDPTQFRDPVVPDQTQSSESTELPLQQMPQGPATTNRTAVAQSLCNAPYSVATQFQDPAVPIQTHSSESTDLFQQMALGPATLNQELRGEGTPESATLLLPNQEVHLNLHEGEDSSALGGLDHAPSDLELSFGRFDQEAQDCYNFIAQNFCKASLRIEQDVESSSDLDLWDWYQFEVIGSKGRASKFLNN